MNASLSLRNIGPIVEFDYDLRGYGLHVIKGPQGAGKTTVLRTVQLATTGSVDVKPEKRDGSPRGEASVAGKTLRIVKQTRHEGELTVDGLGDLSIAELHSPNFKDAVTRDRHRIRTLVSLAGVPADASLFHYLLGNKAAFEAIVPHDSLTTNDLVEMTARVKRAIENEAGRIEKREATALADARAQAAIAEASDTEGPHDDTVLQAELERSFSAHSEQRSRLEQLLTEQSDASASHAKAEEARARLETLGGGVTVAEAMTAKMEAKEELRETEEAYRDAKAKLELAESAMRSARVTLTAAIDSLRSAQREEELHSELHRVIDAAGKPGPSDAEVESQRTAAERASERVQDAKRAVADGVRIRAAIKAKAESERFAADAKALRENARRLRDAATDTADVLTAAISRLNDCPLKIAINDEGDPRLVVATDRSEFEQFDELSDGERWIHVVGIAASGNRLIVLPQHAFGELSPSSKEQLHRLAVEHRCYILSAVAEDCELHGESYGSAHTEAAE